VSLLRHFQNRPLTVQSVSAVKSTLSPEAKTARSGVTTKNGETSQWMSCPPLRSKPYPPEHPATFAERLALNVTGTEPVPRLTIMVLDGALVDTPMLGLVLICTCRLLNSPNGP
jgi:hypothetical protein